MSVRPDAIAQKRVTGSQAIERALALLDCFTSQTPTVSLTEFAAKTGLTTSTTHRMLRTLERHQYLVRDPHINRYSVGPAVVELAQIPLRLATSGDLVAIALPYLDRLRSLTGETAGLHVLTAKHRMCVAELVSHEPIRMASGVGVMRDLNAGAAGKVISAYLMADTAVERADVGAEYALTQSAAAEIRRLGYALSFGETVRGAAAIAVPVLGPVGVVLGAINVTGPENRWTRRIITSMASKILAEVASLSAQFGAPAK